MALVPAENDSQYDGYKKDKAKWVKENAPEELELKKMKEESKDGTGSKK